jgi:hypothetical protein
MYYSNMLQSNIIINLLSWFVAYDILQYRILKNSTSFPIKLVSHAERNTVACFISGIENTIFIMITGNSHWTLKLLMHIIQFYQLSCNVRLPDTLCYILIHLQNYTLFQCCLAHPNHWVRRMGLKPQTRSLMRKFVGAPERGLPCRNVIRLRRLL